jgi:hypothetical protein
MQVRRLLEEAVDELPDPFRIVFIMRDVEGMSTEETASHLSSRIETVKTRLHRARKLMRKAIEKELSGAFSEVFPFGGARRPRCRSGHREATGALSSHVGVSVTIRCLRRDSDSALPRNPRHRSSGKPGKIDRLILVNRSAGARHRIFQSCGAIEQHHPLITPNAAIRQRSLVSRHRGAAFRAEQ